MMDTHTAIRVDFLGPPGIGKSTLCKRVVTAAAARETMSSDAKWLDIAQARKRAVKLAYRNEIPCIPVVRRPARFCRLIAHGISHYLFKGIQAPFGGRELEALQDELLLAFLADDHGFIETLIEHWHDPDVKLAPRAIRYDEMLKCIRDWLFIITYSEASILADNSRLTRGMSEMLSNPEFPDGVEMASAYLQSVFRPSGVVHMVAPEPLIIERIKMREQETGGWRNPGHQDLDDVALTAYSLRRLEVNEHAMAFLRSNNVPTLQIDAASDLVDNVEKVQQFLTKIQAPGQ
jgi:hypothetical protein